MIINGGQYPMKIFSKLYNYIYSFVTATPIINDSWRFSHTPVNNNLLFVEKLLYQIRKARRHQTELDILYDNTLKEDITDVV